MTHDRGVRLGALRGMILAAVGMSLGWVGCDGTVVEVPWSPAECTDPVPFPAQYDELKVSSEICAGGEHILQVNGDESGLVRCAGGEIHRVKEVPCVQPDLCAEYLIHPCTHDDDCGPDGYCLCGGTLENGEAYSRCEPVEGCRTGADCSSGSCLVIDAECDVGRLVCTIPETPCSSDPDCPDGYVCTGVDGQCVLLERPCPVPGRALTVAGQPRVSPLASRSDWCAHLVLEDEPLSSAERARRAAAWADIAAFEHASVASFARFSLQLLALGAPADLVRDTHVAALDEVEHARIAYAVASAYAGAPLGPGPLDLEGVQLTSAREAVALALIAEGCIGETLNVAMAREEAEATASPTLRAIQLRIADDEARHATLAWRALAWLVAEDPTLARVVRAAVAGRAPASALAEDVMREVVRPCAEALLGRAA